MKKRQVSNVLKKEIITIKNTPLYRTFAEPNSGIDFKGEITISYSFHYV